MKYVVGSHVMILPPELQEPAMLSKLEGRGPHVDMRRLHWSALLVDVKRDKWSLRSKRSGGEQADD